jgi:hypothetical protein
LNPKPEESLHTTDDQVQGWKRIEASLNAADQAFDETLRQKVKQFHPKYEPHSWPILLQRWQIRATSGPSSCTEIS